MYCIYVFNMYLYFDEGEVSRGAMFCTLCNLYDWLLVREAVQKSIEEIKSRNN